MGPDQASVVAARDTGDDLLAAPGSLGVLDVAVDRVLALGGPALETGTLVLVGADHPVAELGVSAYPASVTADVLAAARAGASLGATVARQAGLAVTVCEATADPQGNLRDTDAMTLQDTIRLVALGERLGREAAGAGLVCLGEVGIGNTTVAAALSCLLLGLDPQDAVGLGSGADSAILDLKRSVVSDALSRVRIADARAADDPMKALAALGGPEFAVLTGLTLGAASGRVPVVLDGLATSVAALLAVRLEPGARSALVAGQRSRERAHAAVLTELGLEPLLDLRLRAGEGVGACLAAQMLLSAIASRRLAGRVR